MHGSELFAWLEKNFRHYHTVQFERSDISDIQGFSPHEKAALLALWKKYETVGDGIRLAVIWIDNQDKDSAIAYLDEILKNFS